MMASFTQHNDLELGKIKKRIPENCDTIQKGGGKPNSKDAEKGHRGEIGTMLKKCGRLLPGKYPGKKKSGLLTRLSR